MHRFASVAVIAVTAYFLIATSKAPCTATPQTVTLTSRGTCGPDTTVAISVDARCQVTLDTPDAGLPLTGSSADNKPGGTLVNQYVGLYSAADSDAGYRTCNLTPNDAGTGWDFDCVGADINVGECSGTLSP